jgi:hypothetical protein
MAGKKPTPVKPAPSSAQHTSSAAPSPKKASAAGKISEERSAPAKKKPDPEAGAKRKKQQASGEAGTPEKKGKKQQSPGKAEKPAAAATTPTKEQQKEAGREKQQGPGKRKRGDAESQKDPRSPNIASDAGVPTPVKKKHKDKKAAVADSVACSFPTARVRQLMRAEDNTIRASGEAVFLINKASVCFPPPTFHRLFFTMNSRDLC